nr:MAG TPA: hypothetical protein [Caudoviricetes sp.]
MYLFYIYFERKSSFKRFLQLKFLICTIEYGE